MQLQPAPNQCLSQGPHGHKDPRPATINWSERRSIHTPNEYHARAPPPAHRLFRAQIALTCCVFVRQFFRAPSWRHSWLLRAAQERPKASQKGSQNRCISGPSKITILGSKKGPKMLPKMGPKMVRVISCNKTSYPYSPSPFCLGGGGPLPPFSASHGRPKTPHEQPKSGQGPPVTTHGPHID